MTNYEALIFNRGTVENLARLAVKQADYKYIDLYGEYLTLRAQGNKMLYIANVLGAKYKVSERKFYRLIKAFGTAVR